MYYFKSRNINELRGFLEYLERTGNYSWDSDIPHIKFNCIDPTDLLNKEYPCSDYIKERLEGLSMIIINSKNELSLVLQYNDIKNLEKKHQPFPYKTNLYEF